MDLKNHYYRVGSHSENQDDVPSDTKEFDEFISASSKRIEPWLSAGFQAEHLNVVLGSGFTAAIGFLAGAKATGMSKVKFGTTYDSTIDNHAESSAKAMKRGTINIEDQFRSALAVLEGLKITNPAEAQ